MLEYVDDGLPRSINGDSSRFFICLRNIIHQYKKSTLTILYDKVYV